MMKLKETLSKGDIFMSSCLIFYKHRQVNSSVSFWCLHYVMLLIPVDSVVLCCVLNIFHLAK